MKFFILLSALSALIVESFEVKLYGTGTHYHIPSLSDTCCTSCVFPEMKFYTVDSHNKQCSETCLTRKEFVKLQYIIPGLTQDKKSDLPCETYNYHIYNSTKKKGVCPVCAEFDVYDKDYIDVK